MKYLKMLGLAAVAAAALAAFSGAGTASAAVLCSATESPCSGAQKWPSGTTLDFSITSGTSLTWINEGESIQTCKTATLKTDITNGSSTSTVTGNNTALSFSQCTYPNTFTQPGSLEIHSIAGTSNGTVTASGEIGWTFNSIYFGSCLYGWESGAVIGELTEGTGPILHMNTGIKKLSGSNFACPENGTLVGTFALTEPSSTTLSVSSS